MVREVGNPDKLFSGDGIHTHLLILCVALVHIVASHVSCVGFPVNLDTILCDFKMINWT